MLVACPVFTLVTAFVAYAGYFAMFTRFVPYDDEGYWLIALRSFSLHGGLYHNTYTQAGPFNYELWAALFPLLGVPFDTDAARVITLAIWVATSLCLGVSLWLLTRRLSLGVLGQVTTFLLLRSLIGEPMDPGGLACFLISILLLGVVLTVRQYRNLGMALIGVTSAALLLTKVNVGIFVAAAVCYTLLICWPTDRWMISRQLAGGLALLATPFALMSTLIGRAWVDRYLALITLSVIGLIAAVGGITADRCQLRRVQSRAAVWWLFGATCLGIVVMVGVLLSGTSPSEFIHGAFLSQRNLARVTTGSFIVSDAQLAWASVWAAAAVTYLVLRRRLPPAARAPVRLVGWARIVVGAWICVAVVGGVSLSHDVSVPIAGPFVLVVPMAWVSLLQPTGDVATPRLSFARLLIGTMGVLLTLQAFPVAGNQLAWGSLGLVAVGVLILDDGLVLLRSHAASNYRLTLRVLNDHVGRVVPSTAVVALVLLLLVGNARYALASDHAAFDSHRSMALPGAQDLHLQAKDTATFQQMSSLLRSHCSTFQSLPGLNSFYFFTGLPPPTDLNTTQWMYLFDDGTQQRIVDRLREIPRLCVLEDADMALLWRVHADKPLPQDSPLLRYIRASFVPFQQVGPLVLLTRGSEGTLGPTAAVPLCDGGPHSIPLCQ